MGKSKEEDKIEKIIRILLKLPENRRCINCNNLGPQYVCTTFWTFVCTNCSGVHREFTHRVKSVSMAKFSMEEVNALQAGGNEKARQIYFKAWDPHRNHFPEHSNIHQIRDFIKNVYVDRRYTGGTHPVSVPRKSGMYGSYERRRAHSGDNSTFQEKSVDGYGRYTYDELRSPQYSREHSKVVGIGASSSHFEDKYGSYQVDDPIENCRSGGFRISSSCHEGRGSHFKVDGARETSRYGGLRASSPFEGSDGRFQANYTKIAGRAATQMFTTEDIKPRRSPDRTQSSDVNSPNVCHVKEVLGENSVALRVANNPKFAYRRCVRTTTNAEQEGGRHKESHKDRDRCRASHRRTISATAQDSAESSSKLSVSNAELKPKSGSAGSLLAIADFPSPSDRPAQKPDPETHDALKAPLKQNSCNAHPNNTLEFLLQELSTPVEMTPSDQSEIPCDGNAASSRSSNNLSTCHHVPTPPTRESPTFEVVPILPSGFGDPSHVATAQASDERTSFASASAATPSFTLSTGMAARSTDTDKPQVAAYQVTWDLLDDDDVPAIEEAGRKQYSRTQHLEHSGNVVSDRSSTSIQVSHSNEGTENFPTTSYPAPCAPVKFDSSTAPSSQPDLGPTRETKSYAEMHLSLVDAKSGGRTELPADLFAYPYQLSSMPASGWHTCPNYGMGLNMHCYPPQMKKPPLPSMAKSRNPFDTDDNTAQSHVNMFASKETLQGGLTNMFTPSGMSNTTHFESHLPAPESTVSPVYPSSAHHQPSSSASAGAYLGQHSFHNKIPTSIQGTVDFGGRLGPSVPLQLNHQNAYRYPAPADQISFTMGRGNPFG